MSSGDGLGGTARAPGLAPPGAPGLKRLPLLSWALQQAG